MSLILGIINIWGRTFWSNQFLGVTNFGVINLLG
jgi:hypothetical protein